MKVGVWSWRAPFPIYCQTQCRLYICTYIMLASRKKENNIIVCHPLPSETSISHKAAILYFCPQKSGETINVKIVFLASPEMHWKDPSVRENQPSDHQGNSSHWIFTTRRNYRDHGPGIIQRKIHHNTSITLQLAYNFFPCIILCHWIILICAGYIF